MQLYRYHSLKPGDQRQAFNRVRLTRRVVPELNFMDRNHLVYEGITYSEGVMTLMNNVGRRLICLVS